MLCGMETAFGDLPRFLTTREASSLARLHRDSLLRKVRLQTAPQPVRISQKYLFERDAFLRWLETGEFDLPGSVVCIAKKENGGLGRPTKLEKKLRECES